MKNPPVVVLVPSVNICYENLRLSIDKATTVDIKLKGLENFKRNSATLKILCDDSTPSIVGKISAFKESQSVLLFAPERHAWSNLSHEKCAAAFGISWFLYDENKFGIKLHCTQRPDSPIVWFEEKRAHLSLKLTAKPMSELVFDVKEDAIFSIPWGGREYLWVALRRDSTESNRWIVELDISFANTESAFDDFDPQSMPRIS